MARNRLTSEGSIDRNVVRELVQCGSTASEYQRKFVWEWLQSGSRGDGRGGGDSGQNSPKNGGRGELHF